VSTDRHGPRSEKKRCHPERSLGPKSAPLLRAAGVQVRDLSSQENSNKAFHRISGGCYRRIARTHSPAAAPSRLLRIAKSTASAMIIQKPNAA